MKKGDTAFFLESNQIIREVTVVSCSGGMFLIRFKDTGGAIRVKSHRIYETFEAAKASIRSL